jgi:3-deoxy-manno-octulosonate cytidylyltransferase (CMP-KDO synthetase)
MKKPKIAAIIPARFASTRLPAKALIKILGKTLLQRTYERAAICSFDDIYIATDDEKIYSHAKDFSKVLMTCKNCENGTYRIIDALEKNKFLENFDFIVNIQGDMPLISKNTIEKLIERLKSDDVDVATCASLITKKEDIFSKNIVKVIFDEFNNAISFSRNSISQMGKYFYHIGIYGYRRDFLKIYKNLPNCVLQKDLEQLKILENGYKIKVIEVNEKPLSVDVKDDIKKVEKYLCQ